MKAGPGEAPKLGPHSACAAEMKTRAAMSRSEVPTGFEMEVGDPILSRRQFLRALGRTACRPSGAAERPGQRSQVWVCTLEPSWIAAG